MTHFTFVEFHWPSQDFQLDIAIDSGRGNEVWEKKEVRGGGDSDYNISQMKTFS